MEYTTWFTMPRGFYIAWWIDDHYYERSGYSITPPVVP